MTFFGVLGNPFARSESTSAQTEEPSMRMIDAENDPEAASRALQNILDNAGNVTELLVEDSKVGTGRAVQQGDTIAVHYMGLLRDGTRFDDSTVRGQPFVFTVGAGSVIRGWDVGVVGMREGGERVLVIPPSMGYGDRTLGVVPPNSTLLFAITLLEIR
jgi:FKBP-type peptidyl-prolyl cis-trans isomerase